MRETNVLLTFVLTLGLKIQQKSCHVCEYQLTKPRGSFTSPDYPRPYKRNSECEWDIRAPANYSIEIMFLDFQLESTFSCIEVNRPCICDYVEILKETRHGNMTRTGIYCMRKNYPPRVIEISSSHVTVIFRSDATISERGFLATYIMQPPYSGNKNGTTTSFPTAESTVATPTDTKSTSLVNSSTQVIHQTSNLTTGMTSSQISTMQMTTADFASSFKASPTTIYNKTEGFAKHEQKVKSFSLVAVVVPLVTMAILLLALMAVWYSRRRKQLKAQKDQPRIHYGNDNDGFGEQTITVEIPGDSRMIGNAGAEEISQKEKFPILDDIQENNLSKNNEAFYALPGQKQNENPLYSNKTQERYQDNCLYYGEPEYNEKAVKKGRTESLTSLYAISGPSLETSFMENNSNNVYESLPRVNEKKPRAESCQSVDSNNSLYAVSDVRDSSPTLDETFVSAECPLYERLI